jgi:hypothetical protein
MADKSYSMVQECADQYSAQLQADGSLEIALRVPRRFADLWLTRLADLRTTDAEINEYAPLNPST